MAVDKVHTTDAFIQPFPDIGAHEFELRRSEIVGFLLSRATSASLNLTRETLMGFTLTRTTTQGNFNLSRETSKGFTLSRTALRSFELDLD